MNIYKSPFPEPFIFFNTGSHLLSHTVSSAVPSAAYVLTVVFGMGTGVSRKRIATGKFYVVSLIKSCTICGTGLLRSPSRLCRSRSSIDEALPHMLVFCFVSFVCKHTAVFASHSRMILPLTT